MPRAGYFSLAFLFATILLAVVQAMNPPIPSIVGWPIVAIFGILFIAFLVVGIRKKEIQKSLVPTPHTYAIGLSGMTGYPKEPENADWLCFEVAVNPIDKPIDKLDLLIDDKKIPANHWPGKNVASFNVYFNVTEWRWKGKNQVELIAYVEGKGYSSGRITIDFNIEPGVIGHRI
jgi:hypothetical protein